MNKTTNRPRKILAVWATALSLAGALHAQPAGQWNFTNGNLAADVGPALEYAGSSAGTTFGTTTALGIPDIGGTAAPVMKFAAGENGGGYRMRVPIAANGGGNLVNEYTLIMDVLYPAGSDSLRRPLLETDLGFFNAVEGAEISVNAANRFAVLNNSAGSIAPNTWYRLGLVVSGSANQVTLYINGQEQGTFAAGGLNGRLAINSNAEVNNYAELFKDLNGATAEGYVSSVQFRGSVLSPGQMLALGAPSATGIPQVIPPVPPYFRSRTPGPNATGVRPDVTISAVLDQGDRVITPGSVRLLLNGVEVNANIVAAAPTYTISYTPPALLNSGSSQTIGVRYVDNVAGEQTVSWSFTVTQYQSLSLPTPVHLETFEGLAVGSLPAGWSVTNNTTLMPAFAGIDYFQPRSDAYLNWVLIDNTITDNWVNIGTARRYNMPPIAIDGALIPGIVSGKFMYAESDVRSASQVQVMFTRDYDLTGVNNVFVSYYSMYEQNQDSIASLEYSINGGTTWLPVIYMVNGRSDNPDVLRFPNGDVDAVATLTTARSDQAHGLAYGAFIGAEVTQALAPFISGRIDDDQIESKRVEVFRLAAADNQPAVRFRFMQAGTASWYWGIDNFGLYSINTPVITTQPLAQTKSAGDSVTFSVVATINPPFEYEWQFNGVKINGATSDTYTIPSVDAIHDGEYRVLVKNSDGTTPSATVRLTVITAPQITSQPQSVLVSAGAPASFSVQALGRQPISYQWYVGETLIDGATSPTYTIPVTSTANSGDYTVVLSNSDNEEGITSNVAVLTVFDGPITTDLALHLTFDGNLQDSSGQGINGTPVGNIPFSAGSIGQAAGFSTTAAGGRNYITLGAPAALNFGTSTDFTISFWINYAQRFSDPSVIGNKDWDSGGNQGWVFAPSGSGLKWNIADADRVRRDSPGLGTLDNGQWHHFATTFDRSGLAITYINGVRVHSVDISGMTKSVDTPAGLSVNIGEDGTGTYNDIADGSPGFPDAKIDDLGIWRRALTPEEVQAVAAAGLEGKNLTQAVAVTPTLGSVIYAPSGGNLNLNWTPGTGIRLQRATSLTPPVDWQDVPGTEGVGSYQATIGSADEYFRLFRP
jgi:hypothetical protein